MPLQFKNIAVGNLQDDVSGNNYAANKAVYILNLNNTLAQIYSDEAGTIPIIQDGVNNVTGAKGVFGFWVEAGDYFVQVGANKYRVSITGADYFNNRIDETVNLIVDSVVGRGAYYPVGSFEAGFTYTDINQVGTFGGADYYIYTGGLTNLPHSVTAGTNPTLSSDYAQVFYGEIDNVQGLRTALNGFATVQDMRNNITAQDSGNRVEWRGYYSESDGGSNWGIVKTGDSTSLVDDGGSIFVIVNDAVSGVWVEANTVGRLSPAKFGAVENQDSTTAMQNLYAVAKQVKINKPYLVSGTVSVNSDTVTKFAGSGMVTMTANNTPMFHALQRENVFFVKPVIRGKGETDTASTLNADNNTANAKAYGIWFDECTNVGVYNGDVRYFKNDGIRSAYGSRVKIKDNYVEGTYPDADIPIGNTGRQQFGIVVYAESAAEKGATMREVVVDKTASRHNNSDITISGNTVTSTAIAICVYPGYNNVSITNNKTFGQLTQHSIYCYGGKKCLISKNQLASNQSVGIKVSCNVPAYLDIPSEIDVKDNQISNTIAPSISFEIFDKLNNGSFSVDKASVCFERCNITGNNIFNGQDIAVACAVMRNSTIQSNTIYDMSPTNTREMINLRTFGGRINDNVLKDDEYGALGGSMMIGKQNALYFENNVMENLCKAQAGYYATLAKPVEPFAFTTDRYVNWYGLGATIINDATKEVYLVAQGGVAGNTAPTGAGDVVSGECVFRYIGLYNDLTFPIIVKRNTARVGGGTQAVGCMSFNDQAFDLYVSDNYADPQIAAARLYGTIYEYEGNNTLNSSRGSVTFAPMAKGSGNNYIASALPTTGTYEKGDIIWHPDPVALSYTGWVCVNRNPAGTGSTWQKFGALVS
ncbi:hypothetical protein [Pseudoalteromonas sp.]|uniref:hypothetical protein n=1 Tax=Pseudoalteromonas sp. TaxID=53249 RepID=UPI003D147E2E